MLQGLIAYGDFGNMDDSLPLTADDYLESATPIKLTSTKQALTVSLEYLPVGRKGEPMAKHMR